MFPTSSREFFHTSQHTKKQANNSPTKKNRQSKIANHHNNPSKWKSTNHPLETHSKKSKNPQSKIHCRPSEDPFESHGKSPRSLHPPRHPSRIVEGMPIRTQHRLVCCVVQRRDVLGPWKPPWIIGNKREKWREI